MLTCICISFMLLTLGDQVVNSWFPLTWSHWVGSLQTCDTYRSRPNLQAYRLPPPFWATEGVGCNSTTKWLLKCSEIELSFGDQLCPSPFHVTTPPFQPTQHVQVPPGKHKLISLFHYKGLESSVSAFYYSQIKLDVLNYTDLQFFL